MKNKQPKKVKVYKGDKLIKTYESMAEAERAHFPNKFPEYLSYMFRTHNGVFTDEELKLTFVKSMEKGFSQNYRKYFVHDKHTGRKFAVVSTNELLKLVNYGHNSVFHQFRVYGNYEDNQYKAWRIA